MSAQMVYDTIARNDAPESGAGFHCLRIEKKSSGQKSRSPKLEE